MASNEKLELGAEQVLLLKHLLAIELWRGGLTQAQIRARLGLNINVVNAMLKGVRRDIKLNAPVE